MRVEIPRDDEPLRYRRDLLCDAVPAGPELGIWEGGVTTCIAAISMDDKLVSASDTRMSFSGMFAADGVVKQEPFHREWLVLIGGSDVSQAIPVVDKASKILRGKRGDVDTVKNGFKQAYREHWQEAMTDELLAPFDMTLKDFKRNGRRLTQEIYAHTLIRIREFNLGCAFLVYGYDDRKRPHIFTVRNPGKVEIHDKPGFWAIGTGARAALNMLCLLEQSREGSWLSSTIYNVLAAKYASESASDVGPETFFSIVEYGSMAFSTEGMRIEPTMRAIWEKEGKPRMPGSIPKIIEQAKINFWPKRKPQKDAKAVTLSISQT